MIHFKHYCTKLDLLVHSFLTIMTESSLLLEFWRGKLHLNVTTYRSVQVLVYQRSQTLLSLYFTATQNFCVGALRWPRPPTPEFCVGETNMLVSKNAKIFFTPHTKPRICITPDAKPKRKSVECTFHVHFMFFVLISFAFGG